MMMVTRAQMEAARHPDCIWTATMLSDAIEARFPGGAPVDLALLIAAWLADASLGRGTLSHCAIIAKKLSGAPGIKGVWFHPRSALTAIAATL